MKLHRATKKNAIDESDKRVYFAGRDNGRDPNEARMYTEHCNDKKFTPQEMLELERAYQAMLKTRGPRKNPDWKGFFKKNATNENDFDPKDRATLRELKDALAKASDDMDDHPGAAKYEAAYRAAEDTYNDFIEKAKTVNNSSELDDLVKVKALWEKAMARDKAELAQVQKQIADVQKLYRKEKDLQFSIGVAEDKIRLASRTNDKAGLGDIVDYGPDKWKVERVEGNRYFLRQVGGSGMVADNVEERNIRKS